MLAFFLQNKLLKRWICEVNCILKQWQRPKHFHLCDIYFLHLLSWTQYNDKPIHLLQLTCRELMAFQEEYSHLRFPLHQDLLTVVVRLFLLVLLPSVCDLKIKMSQYQSSQRGSPAASCSRNSRHIQKQNQCLPSDACVSEKAGKSENYLF